MYSGRNVELDILKGFGILLMVFDHIGWGETVHTYIQSFHMPLFFIVSGYLWKNGHSISNISKKRFKTVIVPYIIFALMYLLILLLGIVLGVSDRNFLLGIRAIIFFPTDMQNMPVAPALWFLPCFYLCNVLYAFFSKKLKEKKWVGVIILAMIGFCYSSLTDLMLPFALEPLMVTPMFMWIGEMIKKNEKRIFLWIDKWWVLIIIIIAEMIFALYNGSCDLRSARYHNCVLYIINACIGTMAWWGIARKVLLIPLIKTEWISYLSLNSITFLCTNQLFILFCKMSSSVIINDSIIIVVLQKIITLIIVIMLCISANEVLSRTRFKFIIGR